MWFRWKTDYSERMIALRGVAAASSHYAMKLRREVMRAWLEYVGRRRDKLYLKRVAMGSHNSALTTKCLSRWKTRFHRSRQMVQFKDLIAQKNRLCICRRVMAHWKFCILTHPKLNLPNSCYYHFDLSTLSRYFPERIQISFE